MPHRCTHLASHDILSAGTDLSSILRDQPRHSTPQLICIHYFDDRVRVAKLQHRISEIRDEGTDDDGFAQRRRLDHVAAVLSRAQIDERSADKDNISEAVELAELAHGVAEHYHAARITWLCYLRPTQDVEAVLLD